MKIKLLKSKCYFDSNCRCFSSNWYSYPSFFKIQYLWKKERKRLRGACGERGEPRFINENWAPFEDEDKGGTCGESEGHRFVNGNWVHFPFDGDDKARKNKSSTPDPAKGNDHSLGENENSKDPESNDPSLGEDEDSKDTESNDPSLGEDEDSKDTESNDPSLGEDEDSKDTESNDPSLGEDEDSKDTESNDPSLGEDEDSKDTESNDPSLGENENSKDPESNDPSLGEDEDSKDPESNDSDGTGITIPVYPSETPPHIAALWLLCEHCNYLNYKKLLKGQEHMCSHCEYHFPMASPERIEFLIDHGTWHPVDVDMASPDPDPSESDSKEQSESDSKEQSESDSKEQSESDSKEQSESDSKDKSESDSKDQKSLVDKRLQKKILFFKSVILKKMEKESCKSDSKEDLQPDSKNKENYQSDSEDKEEFDFFSEDKQGVELDSDSEDKQGVELDSDSKNKSYPDHLNSYRNKTGLNEAIQTGVGKINGIPAAFGIMEFEFMGGSMGSVVGEKITRLIEYAINQSLPLIIVCASGGARMQEGSVSLMQMGKISCTLLGYEVSKNKLIYISILASPTTGGVTASFGTLGDIILGEPNSYIAFAGKRVIEETLKQPIPEGSQEAEPLFEKGVLDQIIPRKLFKRLMTEFLKFHGFNPL